MGLGNIAFMFGMACTMVMFQNCAPVHMQAIGATSANSKLGQSSVDGSVPSDAITNIIDGVASSEPPAGTHLYDERGDEVVCIGNGIKVPAEFITQCAGDDECVSLCFANVTEEVDFHSARVLLRSGATLGQCI